MSQESGHVLALICSDQLDMWVPRGQENPKLWDVFTADFVFSLSRRWQCGRSRIRSGECLNFLAVWRVAVFPCSKVDRTKARMSRPQTESEVGQEFLHDFDSSFHWKVWRNRLHWGWLYKGTRSFRTKCEGPLPSVCFSFFHRALLVQTHQILWKSQGPLVRHENWLQTCKRELKIATCAEAASLKTSWMSPNW